MTMGKRMARLWLPISVTARRLGFHVNTVTRAMDDGTLPFIRFRGTRRLAAGLVDYVERAVRSGRTGSVEDFAAMVSPLSSRT